MSMILNHEADILSRLEVSLTPQGARDFLKLDFSLQDRRRMEELLDRGNHGTRTADEDREAMEFERVGHLLSMLKSIARRALKHESS